MCECECGAYAWCGDASCTNDECPACRAARVEEELRLLAAMALNELPPEDDPRRI